MENLETSGGGSYRVAIVGESSYASNLAKVDQGRRARGEEVKFDACVVPDSANPKDADAIKVITTDTDQIGYLAREDAARYKPFVDGLFEAHRFLSCPAKLVGSECGKSNLRVVLDLPEPHQLIPIVRPILEAALLRAQSALQEQKQDANDDLAILLRTGETVHSEDLPPNEDFRFPDDPGHFIRLEPETGKGWSFFEQEVPVSGISHEPARSHAEAFIKGKKRRVSLERDPTNPFDVNAVKVIGVWLDENANEHTGQIGFLPRELAKRIASELSPETPLAAEVELMFVPGADRSPGIRMNVLRPRAKPLSPEDRRAAQNASPVILVSTGQTIRYGELIKGQDFTNPNEPAGWIHVAGENPEGDWALATAAELNGIHSGTLRDTAVAFIGGTARRLELDRDPTTQAADKPIRVFGAWRDSAGQGHREHVGWLEQQIVRRLAQESLLGGPLCATIRCMGTAVGSPAITIDIWRPRKKGQRSASPPK